MTRTLPDETPGLVDAVPAHLLDALRRYGLDHAPIGGFLAACLANDLIEAVIKADAVNIARLQGIVKFIYNAMPSDCHGSYEKVQAWLKERCPVKELPYADVDNYTCHTCGSMNGEHSFGCPGGF